MLTLLEMCAFCLYQIANSSLPEQLQCNVKIFFRRIWIFLCRENFRLTEHSMYMTSSLLHYHFDVELRRNFCIWYFGRKTGCTDCRSVIPETSRDRYLLSETTMVLHCVEVCVTCAINLMLLDHLHTQCLMLLLLLWLVEGTEANSFPRPELWA
jgi:hypothetical protein